MSFLPLAIPAWVTNKAAGWMQIVKALPYDGGPSVTRWVYLRTAEVVSLVLVMMAGAAVYEVAKYRGLDAVLAGLILGLATALFAFAKGAQATKLAVDAKTPGAASSVESGPVSSKVQDEGGKGDDSTA